MLTRIAVSLVLFSLCGAALAAPKQPPAQAPPSREPEKRFPTETDWRLVEMNGRPVPRDVTATLRVDTALRGSGSAACNNWSATLWPVAGQHLVMSFPALTHKQCSAALMAFERSYLTALRANAQWDLVADALVVRSATGTLRFVRDL